MARLTEERIRKTLREERPKIKLAEGLTVDVERAYVDMFKRNGCHGSPTYLPTTKQFLLVKYMMEGMSLKNAFFKAGYSHKSRPGDQQRYSKTFAARNVQILVNFVLGDYIRKRQLSAQKILDRALETYDRCETAKEQLEVLKFIKSMMPKGPWGCPRKDCPIGNIHSKM